MVATGGTATISEATASLTAAQETTGDLKLECEWKNYDSGAAANLKSLSLSDTNGKTYVWAGGQAVGPVTPKNAITQKVRLTVSTANDSANDVNGIFTVTVTATGSARLGASTEAAYGAENAGTTSFDITVVNGAISGTAYNEFFVAIRGANSLEESITAGLSASVVAKSNG